MKATLDDEATVISRILEHIDSGTTDVGQDVWHEPVHNYTSKARFAAELSQVLRRTATPFCPSAALSEPGSFVARDASLIPIVAVRGRDGVVRAFRNACRHRGAQVVPTGAGRKAAFTCRFHAWSYGLDGALRGIPHDYGFPCVNKDEYGLVPVKAEARPCLRHPGRRRIA